MSQARPLSPVLQALGNALEFALNRVLALDARTQGALQALQGQAIELEWAGVGLGLRADIEQGRVRIGPRGDSEPALSVSSTLAGLASLLAPQAAGAPTGKIKMSGDVELARRLEQLTREFSPDFEQALRTRLGDPVASAIARALRGAFDFARTSAQRLAEDAADYARDESRAAVAADELRAFHDDVDRVRDAGERLAARVAQLHARLTEHR